MKKIVSLIFVLSVMVVLTGPVMAETITIVGTGSGMQVLKMVGEAFSQNNPGVIIEVPDSIGSGGGIKAVGNDKNIIGRVARGIKEKEKHYGLSYVPFTKMPIVFFVNKSAGVSDLTPQQICDIYSGKVTNWAEVGGNKGKIRVIRREDGDSSLSVLLKGFPGFKDIALTKKSKTTFSDPETCKTCEETKNAIAFGTYINAKNYNVDILTINGEGPTDMTYPYSGTLALIFKEMNKKGHVEKFVEFATSEGAHDTIKKSGGLPIL
jgi:phosphate transport system substrate-binding protein